MKKFDSINVIPFIDIMLVLLAIVLATASFISQGKIEVNIPQAKNASQVVSSDFKTLITITDNGQYYFEEQPVSLDELELLIADFEPQTAVTLKVDAQSNFQLFVSLTDLLKKANLNQVSVITQQSKEITVPE